MSGCAALVVAAAACRIPPLSAQPWSHVEPRALGLTVQQPLNSVYAVDGDFEVGIPSVGFAPLQGDSDVTPVYGLVVAGRVALTEELFFFAGVDFRDYEVNELQPLSPLLVELEALRTLQFIAGMRYLFRPPASAPRLRPYAEAAVVFLPRSDVNGIALVSQLTPGNSDVPFEGSLEPYTLLGLGAGLEYHWTDRTTLEAGLTYELPLTRPELFIGVDAFGTSDPEDFVVSMGEIDPGGWILHVGFTWFPL